MAEGVEHPNLFDRIMTGRPHETRGDYTWRRAERLIPGDGYWHDEQSWVVKSRRDHERGLTVVSQPRRSYVDQEVVSRLQFGVAGISLEDASEVAHTFHPQQVVPIRD